ncbi:MAG: tyrosine-type recombinase/integrase [Nannocystaceae bacterium]
MLTMPGRPKIRERRKAPVPTKSAARRWGEERERQLIQHYANNDPSKDGEDDRPDLVKKEVPTLAKFAPRYIEGHCKANRQRPSSIEHRRRTVNNHLIPSLGRKRLDRLRSEDIQRFKAERAHLKHSTLNNILTVLRSILSVAVEWGVLEAMPTKVKAVKEPKPEVKFYDFEQLDRLVLAAEEMGNPNPLLVVLLGAEAGLRRGEMIGLKWSDVDLKRKTLTVARTIWRRQEGPPKGGCSRTVPLAPRLLEALTKHRHLRSPDVLWTAHDSQPGPTTIRNWLNHAQTRAGFPLTGPHVLRHTFCSHLAMQAKPVVAIQTLAGHQHLVTTQRYMHLAPSAVRDAIEGLRRPENWRHAGDGGKNVINIK